MKFQFSKEPAPLENQKLIFPAGFYWGAATSAHQVEGNNHNDWTEWEKENADKLSAAARQKHWPDFIINPPAGGPNPIQEDNYISGRACDHYNRYEEDFDIAKSLNHNAHRFSIEWSRIEPEEGRWDEKEIEHYRKIIKVLRERDIEPFVTLWHWPIPLWLRDKGGWQSRKMPKYFAKYAEKIVSEFKNDVNFWITLNEPEIYTTNSYLRGNWPPQKKNPLIYFLVLRNLITAHKAVYKVIKKIQPNAQVGIAKNNIHFEAASGIISSIFKKIIDWWWNFYFLSQIKNEQDFIGLNHYFHNRIKSFKFNQNKNQKISDMGWELYPEAIYYCLKDLKKYNRPIYITENGLADAKDENREWFIKESLKNVYRAISSGVDVGGYFHWSLLDNFEWDKGFWPRFGLIEIDYKTMERKTRKSGLEYKEIIKSGQLTD